MIQVVNAIAMMQMSLRFMYAPVNV
jgi:hypothetical protein